MNEERPVDFVSAGGTTAIDMEAVTRAEIEQKMDVFRLPVQKPKEPHSSFAG